MKLQLTVQCRPFAKQRPRVTSRGAYMNPAYIKRKRQMVHLAHAAHGRPLPLFTGPVRLDLEFRFKAKGAGDLDNLAGSIMDSFNGVLWHDDRQVERGHWSIERNTGEPDCIALTVATQIHQGATP